MIRCRRFAFSTILLLALPSAFAAEAPSATCSAHSSALLDALARGDYAHAGKDFSARLEAALDADKLEQVWTQIQGQVGTYRAHDAPAPRMVSGHAMVATRLSFANMPLDALVACDDDGRIDTFRLVPATAPASAPQASADGVGEQPLAVDSPLGPLPGILTLPAGDGPFPAVVMVAGSGAQDADESIGPNKPFRDLAQGLASAGIASLRYDKRTHAYAAQVAAHASLTIDEEVTDDALAAAKLLARQPRIDARRVFVLGHSLGAMLAPRIGQRDPRLAGLVMLAAPARPLLELSAAQVREQGRLEGTDEREISASEQAIAAERKLLESADPRHPPEGTFASLPQRYWLSLHAYRQVDVARGLSMPMLFVQGGSDFQVSTKDDFGRWKEAMAGRPNVAFRLYPGLGHLFMPAGKTGTVADYFDTEGHVDAGVTADIAAWIKARPAR